MTSRKVTVLGQSSKRRSRAQKYPRATVSRAVPISALLIFPCLAGGQANCNDRQPVTGGMRGGASGRLCTGRIPLTIARSIDGSSEDPRAQSGATLLRLTTFSYPDGVGDRMQEFPNARGISNIVANSDNEDQQRFLNHDEDEIAPSDMIWIWGQFLDHDMDLSPEAQPLIPGVPFFSESMTIVSPDCRNDILCTQKFPRSEYRMVDNTRQQINGITGFIDASQVYGSDEERARALREFRLGLLKVEEGNMLPYNENDMEVAAPQGFDTTRMNLAGDIRANEQIGLTAMHTLFVREHNRLAGRLLNAFPTSNDQEIYQMARKIVGAEIQKITYDEFLPILLGPLFVPGEYTGYDGNVNPAIATEFSTVAFRVGHTMLSPTLLMLEQGEDLSLVDAFFNPSLLMDRNENMNSLLGGFCHQRAQPVDTFVINEVRNFLFGVPEAGSGLDLVSLNIQRGRDHGIPKYNALRRELGLTPATSFEDISDNLSTQQSLRDAYGGDIELIDSWIGGLAERHVVGGMVGELFATIIGDQFTRSMLGDPFFYLNDDDLRDSRLIEHVVDISTLKFADVLAANTDVVVDPEENVFLIGQPPSVPLTRIRSIDGSGEDSRAQTGATLLRLTTSFYPDGTGNIMEVEPNARFISNVVANSHGLGQALNRGHVASDFVWIWGQFIDHDMDLSPEGHPFFAEEMSIVSQDCHNDVLCTIPFTRSDYRSIDNVREQYNAITGFIDASMVYGSDEERAEALREFRLGRLKVEPGNMLPYNVDRLEVAALEGTDPAEMNLAGDIRANEQIGLTAMHTLFVREHNRLAGLIMEAFPFSSDEEIYQMARKIVAAEIQKITYDEFLPILLGQTFYRPRLEDYRGYDRNVNPAISTEFSTVAFRVGHTMLSPKLLLIGEIDIPLMDAFFNPGLLMDKNENMDFLLTGFCHQRAQQVDTFIIDEVRNFLFGIPEAGVGLDLVSLNIQRGRDHGIPKYNDLRVGLNLDPVASFDDITSNPRIHHALIIAYAGDVNLIDAWVGGLAEDHIAGAMVGELFATIIGDQFTRSMLGDPMFFLNDPDLQDSILIDRVIDVSTITLMDILAANAGLENDGEENAFTVAEN